ncbi:STAS domain-containing protein [Streptomyces sp. MH60]|uniref:STAS domain-containing protein n=1 Tax=Streptomyces sp. MH60 TaxID=1940758 RepID=UPI000CEF5426|nr:STAS domain-containing protein [Streptomyces sp. MH60]PPS91002.1 Anti-sigma-B factor antagonist [Streptomyces sp. MH60]
MTKPHSQLETITRKAASGPVLELLGDLDYDTADRLRTLLSTLALRQNSRLVLDLEGVTFCDSSGITALIVAGNHALAAQAEVALARVPDHIMRVLRIVGLDQSFPIDPGSAAVM